MNCRPNDRLTRMHRMWQSIVLLLLVPISSRAVEIYDRFPDAIHANERYVIYSHGFIVEGDDPKPISPQYGQYDFPAIKQALFTEGGFNLIEIAGEAAPRCRRQAESDYAGWILARCPIDCTSLQRPSVRWDQYGAACNMRRRRCLSSGRVGARRQFIIDL
jgi:hypothetical protein